MHNKYEVQRIYSSNAKSREDKINELAQEGWRLICVSEGYHYFEQYVALEEIDMSPSLAEALIADGNIPMVV